MSGHEETRAHIASTAIRLFVTRGFDNTTVEEIAHAAGISRRTYFRYFASKDEALVSATLVNGMRIAQEARRMPSHLSPLAALRQALLDFAAGYDETPEQSRAVGHLLRGTPRIYGGLLVVHTQWADEFARVVAQRQGHEEPEIADWLIGRMAVAVWNQGMIRWLADRTATLQASLEEVFDRLDALMGAPPPVRRSR